MVRMERGTGILPLGTAAALMTLRSIWRRVGRVKGGRWENDDQELMNSSLDLVLSEIRTRSSSGDE
jgi:hypothetical protein